MSVGFAVFGGVVTVTAANLLMLPVLYVVFKSLADRLTGGKLPKSPVLFPAEANAAAEDRPTDAPSAEVPSTPTL